MSDIPADGTDNRSNWEVTRAALESNFDMQPLTGQGPFAAAARNRYGCPKRNLRHYLTSPGGRDEWITSGSPVDRE